MVDEVVLGNVMVDCDDERKLQRFYGELLGWEMYCIMYTEFQIDNDIWHLIV